MPSMLEDRRTSISYKCGHKTELEGVRKLEAKVLN